MKQKRLSKYYDEIPCKQIRERLANQKISYAEAARRMQDAGIQNVTTEAVRQWCCGFSRPDLSKLKDIASVLGCTINYLFGVDELPQATTNDFHALTGLSEQAIEQLQMYKTNAAEVHTQTLDDLLTFGFINYGTLSSVHFYEVLGAVYRCLQEAREPNMTLEEYMSPNTTMAVDMAREAGFSVLSHEEATELYQQKAVNLFNELLQRLVARERTTVNKDV